MLKCECECECECECGRVKWAQDKVDWAQNFIDAACARTGETLQGVVVKGLFADYRCEQVRLVGQQLSQLKFSVPGGYAAQ